MKTFKLDRLGRDTRIILNTVAELEKHGVRVRSMTEEFDTATSTGRLMLTMLSGFAAHERELTRERLPCRAASLLTSNIGRLSPTAGQPVQSCNVEACQVEAVSAPRKVIKSTARSLHCRTRSAAADFASSCSGDLSRRVPVIVLARDRETSVQAKNTYIAFSLLLPCCLALSLASCQSASRHLGAAKKDGTVELCLSNGDECPQVGGVSPSSISVYRWDNMHDNELVWDTEPKNPTTAGSISGVVTYGVPPKDWINKLEPPALVCGKAYLVNPGAHYLRAEM